MIEISHINLIALCTVLIAAAWLAGLRNGERTRTPRITLRGNWLKMKFGMLWRT